MIGINGAGKSYALSVIVTIFRYIEGLIEGRKVKNEYAGFLIEYSIGNDMYLVDFINNKEISRNGKLISIDELQLPQKLLGTSFAVNDKFVYSSNDTASIYSYLGIRGSESGVGTKTHQKKIGDAIISLSNDVEKSSAVVEILKFLGYESRIQLKFKLRKIKYFFTNELEYSEFKSYFSDWRKRSSRKTEPFYYKHFIDMQENDQLLEVYNYVAKIPELKTKNNYLTIDFDFSKANNGFNQESYKLLRKLMLLDLISSPEIVISKGHLFSIDNASSGEFHFIFNMLNILSYIEQNSLILIDEPEISLHPEWQCRYISVLRKVLSDYPSCHVVIASHSHFLAAELNPESSSITQVINNGKNIIGTIYESDTFGWSVESILYNVFNIKTLRNYYLERDVNKILRLTSDVDANRNEINNILEKLDGLNIRKEDPLNDLINDIKESL